MSCAEFDAAISWSQQSTPTQEFPVIAYFSKHYGAVGGLKDTPKDTVLYASGKVAAVAKPTPHLKGTLAVAKNTDLDGQMVSDPKLTIDLEIYPDGSLSYLVKINGMPVGGMPPTKVKATCVNDVLLTATSGSEVVTVGVALKPAITTVVVKYKQIANFHDYRLAPDASDSHGAGGMFIMYKVVQIVNAGSPKDFVFDVNNVSTITKDKTSDETVTDANILLLGENLTTVKVIAGQTLSVGRCFIKDALTSDPQSLVSAHVTLTYQADPSQPVKMENLDPNGSVAALGNALPNPLRSLCKGG